MNTQRIALDQLTGEQMAGIAWMVSDWDEEG